MTGSRASRQQGPTAWDAGQGRSRNLSVNGLRVKYIGAGAEEKDAANVRSDAPVPSDCCLYYWEAEIIDDGEKGFIGVGFATSSSKHDRLPGWDEGSWGYHGDDGCAFEGTGVPYGPKFGKGDVIGVIWNKAERTISYTKNGDDLGVAFRDIKTDRLFPVVGFRTPREEVLANFGATPFRYDAEVIRQEAKRNARTRIQQNTLPFVGKNTNLLGEIAFDYLSHSGYRKAAEALARDAEASWVENSPSDIQEQHVREQVASAVMSGNIPKALALAESLAPGVLQAHPQVWFKLEVQAFIELIRQNDLKGAINHATVLGTMSSPSDNELLLEVMPLLAYDQPASSPSGHLLQPRVQEQAAEALNSAVLHQLGRKERSALETAYRQLRVLEQELLSKGDAAAELVDLGGMLEDIGLPK